MKKIPLFIFISLLSVAAFAKTVQSENLMIIELETGKVQVELFPDKAPGTVAQIKALVRSGFYDRLEWFRVIDGFIAQTGYPKGSHGKSNLPDLNAEFSNLKFRRGTLGMGHGDDVNSANSQFFICLSDAKCASLTGKYTAFGQVIGGMEAVDALPAGEPPARPGKTLHIRMASDPEKVNSAPKRANSFGNQ